jgi:hypothetical protein
MPTDLLEEHVTSTPSSSGSTNKARNYFEASSNEGSAFSSDGDIIFTNFTKIANNRDITVYSL